MVHVEARPCARRLDVREWSSQCRSPCHSRDHCLARARPRTTACAPCTHHHHHARHERRYTLDLPTGHLITQSGLTSPSPSSGTIMIMSTSYLKCANEVGTSRRRPRLRWSVWGLRKSKEVALRTLRSSHGQHELFMAQQRRVSSIVVRQQTPYKILALSILSTQSPRHRLLRQWDVHRLGRHRRSCWRARSCGLWGLSLKTQMHALFRVVGARCRGIRSDPVDSSRPIPVLKATVGQSEGQIGTRGDEEAQACAKENGSQGRERLEDRHPYA